MQHRGGTPAFQRAVGISAVKDVVSLQGSHDLRQQYNTPHSGIRLLGVIDRHRVGIGDDNPGHTHAAQLLHGTLDRGFIQSANLIQGGGHQHGFVFQRSFLAAENHGLNRPGGVKIQKH